ncbi:serine/threonine protein kinase [Hyalangium rubrum]|uniref:Serine/threonine-protein kinase n=1 Tax=Hyalangium rubrum TaxID=3103134 RepID=A0ABU5HAH5_9BACT|nr:serine/threonine-protein kinase [Hyalangium sp. s54d21]MDY7230479.1 serine/threonine-protein kinase [Hyalangium sp. s54d21]
MERFRAVDPSDLPPGTEVGNWRTVRWRGRGSYGAVYHADPVGKRGSGPFALKVARYAGDLRFEREVEMLSRLRHPNVPRLLDSGEWTLPNGASYPYLVMEWVSGEPLYQWRWHNSFTSREAMKLLAQVARALEATHEVGGVHRDVKGLNVLVTIRGKAMLMDFGSAWYPGARMLTRQSKAPGTPQYASPQAQLHQWRFRDQESARYPSEPADDMYSLGVMAYKLVTGDYPKTLDWKPGEETPQLVCAQKLRPEAQVTVSRELAALIRQLLSEKPSDRGTATEVAQALERAVRKAGRKADQPISAHPPKEPLAERVWVRQLRRELPWMGWLTAAAMGGGLAVRAWEAGTVEPVRRPAHVAQIARDGDGGTSALGDVAATVRGATEMPESKRAGFGLDLPKKPFPGQRRPPCKKPETEIYGGCWVGLRDATPPCGDNAYEWKNGCYWPSFPPRRPETSEQQ